MSAITYHFCCMFFATSDESAGRGRKRLRARKHWSGIAFPDSRRQGEYRRTAEAPFRKGGPPARLRPTKDRH